MAKQNPYGYVDLNINKSEKLCPFGEVKDIRFSNNAPYFEALSSRMRIP